jgi:hypothetical protein
VPGSNLGYLTGWDIRFGIPFREWRVPSKSPIYDIVPNHSWGVGTTNTNNNNAMIGNGGGLNSSGGNAHSILCACGPGDFQSWDLESGRCVSSFTCVIHVLLYLLTCCNISFVHHRFHVCFSLIRHASVYDGW